jgi:hypothetical protein
MRTEPTLQRSQVLSKQPTWSRALESQVSAQRCRSGAFMRNLVIGSDIPSNIAKH